MTRQEDIWRENIESIKPTGFEENGRLTFVGPGTPMGRVMRSYWIPACLSSEIPTPECPPVRVRLLGEDLVAFRDTNGKVGLVEAYCRHRRAPLFFGRNEECGLRCVYHGWKFDVEGNCIDLPSEPEHSHLASHAAITAYPTHEAGQLIWTYMGPANAQPAVPEYEWLRVPEQHLWVTKTHQSCNYLQALEGGIDTAHVPFLHNQDITNSRQLMTLDLHPQLEVDVTDYGYLYAGIRQISADLTYVRGYQFIMPFQKLQADTINFLGKDVPEGGDLNELMRSPHPHIWGHMWVPADDENCSVYNLWYSKDHSVAPMAEEEWRRFANRFEEDYIPGTFKLKAQLENDFFIDREEQRTKTYTGIARGSNLQDVAIQEGMGRIVDRSKELLGTTDKAIVAARELLLEAVEDAAEGRALRGQDPAQTQLISAGEQILPRGSDWRSLMKDSFVATW